MIPQNKRACEINDDDDDCDVFVVTRWRRRAIVTGGGSILRLRNVTESDAGVIQCNASNEHGYVFANVHFTVHGQSHCFNIH